MGVVPYPPAPTLTDPDTNHRDSPPVQSTADKPRLKENIWAVPDAAQFAFVSTTWNTYDMRRDAALVALTVRSHCTGHNDIATIAHRSGLDEPTVKQVVDSFRASGLLAPDQAPQALHVDDVRQHLVAVCRLWGEELARSYIGNRFVTGDLPREALIGWLIEMYHYIRDFPAAIRYAEYRATDPFLREVLHEYARQETGHEHFVLRTLDGLGLSVTEVITSTALLSTRMIGHLMRSLATLDASTMLLVAALVEAQDFEQQSVAVFTDALEHHYGIAPGVFDPYFEHQQIDYGLGHAKLLEQHIESVTVTDRVVLDRIVNDLHDLKHAFDLQATEIIDYYGHPLGRYLPRQAMSFAALEPPASVPE